MRMWIFLVFLCLVFLPATLMCQTPEYIIQKGDQLLITVLGYDDFNSTTTVRDNGVITMPYLGEILAAGISKENLTISIQRKLAEYVQGDTKVTISVLSSIGQRVTILGAVARPENYPMAKELNLLEVLSMAGGFLPDAQLSGVKIFHREANQPVSDVDLEYFIERADIDRIPKVQAGDIVFVPRKKNFVREFGEFFRDAALFFALFRFAETIR